LVFGNVTIADQVDFKYTTLNENSIGPELSYVFVAEAYTAQPGTAPLRLTFKTTQRQQTANIFEGEVPAGVQLRFGPWQGGGDPARPLIVTGRAGL
jgi:hypothetical protein